MQQKTVKSILWYGECSCLQHCKHLYSWWRITQTIGIPSTSQKISQWNRCSTYLKNWCPKNQMRSMEWRQWTAKTLHGSICLWLVVNKSSVFSAQKSTYFQILCCVWVRYTRTLAQPQHGKKDWAWFKKFTGIQKLGQNWWWVNWIRVKYFRRIRHIAAQPQSSRVTVEIGWNTREFYRTSYLHVDVQRRLMGIERQQGKNANQMLNSFLYLQKDSEQDNGHSLDLDQNRNGTLSVKIVHKVNGTKWPKRWW